MLKRISAVYAPTTPPRLFICFTVDITLKAGSAGSYEARLMEKNIPSARKNMPKISFLSVLLFLPSGINLIFDQAGEDRNQFRIELLSSASFQFGKRPVQRKGIPVWLFRYHCIPCLCKSNNASAHRDKIALHVVRISVSVKMFMMMENSVDLALQKGGVREHLRGKYRVLLYDGVFRTRQRPVFHHDPFVNCQLADVMQKGALPQCCAVLCRKADFICKAFAVERNVLRMRKRFSKERDFTEQLQYIAKVR